MEWKTSRICNSFPLSPTHRYLFILMFSCFLTLRTLFFLSIHHFILIVCATTTRYSSLSLLPLFLSIKPRHALTIYHFSIRTVDTIVISCVLRILSYHRTMSRTYTFVLLAWLKCIHSSTEIAQKETFPYRMNKPTVYPL